MRTEELNFAGKSAYEAARYRYVRKTNITLSRILVKRRVMNYPVRKRIKMSEREKQLLFTLSAKDFEFQTFCTGGAGGQHRNAKQNGVRCIHIASGA
jgi:protein subunit release factor B